jgi:TonB family protein
VGVNDSVSAAISARGQQDAGFGAMTGVSALGHAALIAALLIAPADWPGRRVPSERDVMTISLGGATGPRSGGMTAMGGRPVQQVAPPDAKARPEPVQAPAAKPPAMVEPVGKAAKKPSPTPDAPKTTTEQAPGRVPIKGAQLQAGTAVAQTGGTGIGFGLSTGGGGTGGEINLGDFCCPDYLETLLQIIQRNWDAKQQVAGVAGVRFTVQRDGSITDTELAVPSGFAVLDLAAQRAILMSRLPPLPRAYTNTQLTITLSFRYQR